MRARLGILAAQIRPSSSTFPLHREVMHPPVHLWLTGKMDSPNQSVKRWLIRNELGAFWNHTCVMKSQAHSHWEQISHAAWLIKKQTMLHTYTFLCFLIKNTHKKNVCGSSEQTCGGKTKTLTVSSRYGHFSEPQRGCFSLLVHLARCEPQLWQAMSQQRAPALEVLSLGLRRMSLLSWGNLS